MKFIFAVSILLVASISILNAASYFAFWTTRYQEELSIDQNIHNIEFAITQVENKHLVYDISNFQDFTQILTNLGRFRGATKINAKLSSYALSILRCNSTITEINDMYGRGIRYIDGDELAFFGHAITVDYIDQNIRAFSQMRCNLNGMFEPLLVERKQSLLACLNTVRAMI